jgi:hypothetical protein
MAKSSVIYPWLGIFFRFHATIHCRTPPKVIDEVDEHLPALTLQIELSDNGPTPESLHKG